MIEIDIPDFGQLRLAHLILDYNGTLAFDGKLLSGVADLLERLAEHLRIHIITADTFGSVHQAFAGSDFTIHVLPPGNEEESKVEYVRRLGSMSSVCIGNGRNDRLMLGEAGLGIAVLGREGTAIQALLAADIIIPSIVDSLDLLLHPKRIIATMRCLYLSGCSSFSSSPLSARRRLVVFVPVSPILRKKPHRIGSTARAMVHLRQVPFSGTPQGGDEFKRRRRHLAKGCSGDGDHGNQIVQIDPESGNLFSNCRNMLVINPGDNDGIDLDPDILGLKPGDCLHLPIKQQRRGGYANQFFPFPVNPGIEPRADRRINRIDGDGDKADFQFGQGVNMLADAKAIGRETEVQSGMVAADQFKGRKGTHRLGKGIARTSNTGH